MYLVTASFPRKIGWPLSFSALSAAASATAVYLALSGSASQEQSTREADAAAWAEGFSKAMSLNDDFLLDSLSRTVLSRGAARCEVISPAGRVLFPPEADRTAVSDGAKEAAASGRLLSIRETLPGGEGQSVYVPLRSADGLIGVLHMAWPGREETRPGPAGPALAAALAGALILLAAGLWRESRILPIPFHGPAGGAAVGSRLTLSPFMEPASAHVLTIANRVAGSWGDLEALLGSRPRPGDHLSGWEALRDSRRLASAVEGTSWPEPGLILVRQASGDFAILSFFLDGKGSSAS